MNGNVLFEIMDICRKSFRCLTVFDGLSDHARENVRDRRRIGPRAASQVHLWPMPEPLEQPTAGKFYFGRDITGKGL